QTGQHCVFGAAPNAVLQPQNILLAVNSSACTSMPITASYSVAVVIMSSPAGVPTKARHGGHGGTEDTESLGRDRPDTPDPSDPVRSCPKTPWSSVSPCPPCLPLSPSPSCNRRPPVMPVRRLLVGVRRAQDRLLRE